MLMIETSRTCGNDSNTVVCYSILEQRDETSAVPAA